MAERAARNAAAVLQDAARDLERLPTSSVEHRDIVLAGGAEAANAIVATIAAAFPEHTILGEAGGTLRSRGADSSWRWMIDPLDGSRNFAHGYPYYAVSIALLHGGEPTHGVVLDPTRDELFAAIKARGAQLNGVQLHVSPCTRLEQALIGTVFPPRDNPRLAAYLPTLGALMARCAGVRRAGACALDLAYVAAGRLDGFWAMSLGKWDIAAGALLVREAGGRVGDFAGGTEFVKNDEVVAATPGIFVALREAIAGTTARPSASAPASG